MDNDVAEYYTSYPALSLRSGEYVETQRLEGRGELSVDLPSPVTLRPFG